jgi:hypothetical protein
MNVEVLQDENLSCSSWSAGGVICSSWWDSWSVTMGITRQEAAWSIKFPLPRPVYCRIYTHHATEFDTLRTSCLILSIISLACQCVQPSKCMWTLHLKCPRGMKITCSSGWGDRRTGGVLKSCVSFTTPRLCLYFRFWTAFMLVFWIQGFWNVIRVFGKYVFPSNSVHVIKLKRTCENNMQTFIVCAD